jgi:hypothetical protein
MTQGVSIPINHLVALFNASDDTVEMVSTHSRRSGFNYVVGCHFSDLKKGRCGTCQDIETPKGRQLESRRR